MASSRKKSREKISEKFSNWLLSLRRHWFIILVVASFAFASGIEATNWLIGSAVKSYETHIGWKSKEEKILNSISANMQFGAVKAILGEPVFQNGGEKYTEYVFRRKAEWLQVVTDKNNRTMMYAISICDKNFKPVIGLSTGKSIHMMQDTLHDKGEGETRYMISGATANSYLLEGGYEGNPSNYQSFYVGATDTCGSLRAPMGSYDLLNKKKCSKSHLGLQGSQEPYCLYDRKDTEIAEFRKGVVIDTLAITAPGVSPEDLSSRVQIGADRVMLRVLPDYYPLKR